MSSANQSDRQDVRDAIVIGAGVTGIYMLHRLLGQGLDATIMEAGDDLGGTWYWNRYPGARFDSESYSYGYSFDKEILETWNWSEHFAAQPETLSYLNFVTDKLNLREKMQFGVHVKAARFNDDNNTWTVECENGHTLETRFLFTAIGMLSAATMPRIKGIESFEGEAHHTYYWPKDDEVELEGKRVQPEVLELVPIDFAEKHMCVPLFVKENGGARTLYVGMEDPSDLAALDDLGFRTGLEVSPVLVSPSELFEAMDRFYHRDQGRAIGLSDEVGTAPEDGLRAGVDATPVVQESLFPEISEIEESEGDAPGEAETEASSDAGSEVTGDVAAEAEPEPVHPEPVPPVESPDEGTNRMILRALCHLLIEKGVIAREELQQLVQSIQQQEGD